MSRPAARKRQRKAKTKKAVAKASKKETSAQRPELEAVLRNWRTGQAKRLGVPAFRIMSDKVLLGIVETQPRSAAELLKIPGIGIASVEKYGAQIYKILNETRA